MKTLLLTISVLLYSLVPVVGFKFKKEDGPGEVTYRVHSIYIYNFMKEIQWPDEYNKGNFVIGMLGNADMENELRKMAAAR